MNEAFNPAVDRSCPECGGVRVGTRVAGNEVGGGGRDVWLYRAHPGRFVRRRDLTNLVALVCTGCGLVTLYARNVERVRIDAAEHPNMFL